MKHLMLDMLEKFDAKVEIITLVFVCGLVSACATTVVQPSKDPVVNAALLSHPAEVELTNRLQWSHPEVLESIQPALASLRQTRDAVSRLLVQGEDAESGMTVHTAVYYAIDDWQTVVLAVQDAGIEVDGVLKQMYDQVLAGFEVITNQSANGQEKEALANLAILIARIVAANNGIILPQTENTKEHPDAQNITAARRDCCALHPRIHADTVQVAQAKKASKEPRKCRPTGAGREACQRTTETIETVAFQGQALTTPARWSV